MKTLGDERQKMRVPVCATAVVHLFAVKEGLLVWWMFALLGVQGQGIDRGQRKDIWT